MTGAAPVFRLILHDPAEGRWNMSVDHALLHGMEREGARPAVRLYGFAPPTLSIGRFQRANGILDRQAIERDGVTVVRRPTGGQAVLHDGELTYAFVLGRAHVERFSKREVYRFVAGKLLTALERVGLALSVASRRQGDQANPDCFRSTGEYEITAQDGRKLVGSAQIITRSGALQHGAIVLDESNRRIGRYLREGYGPVAAPAHDSTSVAGLLGFEPTFSWMRERLASALADLLPLQKEGLTDEESARAHAELSGRYGTDAWNYTP